MHYRGVKLASPEPGKQQYWEYEDQEDPRGGPYNGVQVWVLSLFFVISISQSSYSC